jgi:hypothetical protein
MNIDEIWDEDFRTVVGALVAARSEETIPQATTGIENSLMRGMLDEAACVADEMMRRRAARSESAKSDPDAVYELSVEVQSNTLTEPDGGRRHVVYALQSSDRSNPRAELTLKFLAEEDPIWKSGQRIRVSVRPLP